MEEQLKKEVAWLMAMAEAADPEVPEGMDILAKLATASVTVKSDR